MTLRFLLSKVSISTTICVYFVTHPCLYPKRNVDRLYSSKQDIPNEILNMDVKEYWVEMMHEKLGNRPVLAIQTEQYYC